MSIELGPDRAVVHDHEAACVPRLVADLVARPALRLEEVLEVAQLTTRLDLKYVLPLDRLTEFLDGLPPHLASLDVDGRRVFSYESTYFDTAGLALYRSHAQGRRRRYKTRTRSYCDTVDAMFEVKLKGRRSETVKFRLPHDFRQRDRLTHQSSDFLERVVGDVYGLDVPVLRPVLTTTYRRATLVDVEHRTRATVDVHLGWSDSRTVHRADHVAVIESKSMSGPGVADAVLAEMGVRPVRMSKYCLGVALLNPDVAANPWSRLLRTQFGWRRSPEAGADLSF
jgi:hypothetical protein